MKKIFLFFFTCSLVCTLHAQEYEPTPDNLAARQWFNDARFGLFIHWGPFSIPGQGEWVMKTRNITVKNYTRLMDFFNPIAFDAAQWVSMAKNAGMQYITLITRHHDGFSMWDTKASDFNIMHTPYHKDIVKMIADECHKQGIKIFFYYSLLDWRRDDYSYWTGRTGQGTGRTVHGNWNNYIQFMEQQLTELLTNYGEVSGIWFDGYWDQTAPEGAADRTPKINWHLDEIYALIHKLQPQCLIGDNHHLDPLPGEDFQMFEQDLPGENKGGLSFQKPSQLPLESCVTMNNSWGFNITDTSYKTTKQLIDLLVKASGYGANLLLNIGPMPDGDIQPEFKEGLAYMGNWLQTYGSSIYNTKGGYIHPQNWGCVTQRGDTMFVHVLNKNAGNITLENFPYKKIGKAYLLKDKSTVQTQLQNATLSIQSLNTNNDEPDEVIVIVGIK